MEYIWSNEYNTLILTYYLLLATIDQIQDRDKEIENLRKYSATIFSQFMRKVIPELKVYSHCDLIKVEKKVTWLPGYGIDLKMTSSLNLSEKFNLTCYGVVVILNAVY